MPLTRDWLGLCKISHGAAWCASDGSSLSVIRLVDVRNRSIAESSHHSILSNQRYIALSHVWGADAPCYGLQLQDIAGAHFTGSLDQLRLPATIALVSPELGGTVPLGGLVVHCARRRR